MKVKARRLARAKENSVKLGAENVQLQAAADQLQESDKQDNPVESSRIPETPALPSTLPRLFSEVTNAPAQGTFTHGSVSDVQDAQVTPVFKTPGPEGPYRDEVVVEIVSLNSQNYAGTVSPVVYKDRVPYFH